MEVRIAPAIKNEIAKMNPPVSIASTLQRATCVTISQVPTSAGKKEHTRFTANESKKIPAANKQRNVSPVRKFFISKF
jgi:hypothetical protein